MADRPGVPGRHPQHVSCQPLAAVGSGAPLARPGRGPAHSIGRRPRRPSRPAPDVAPALWYNGRSTD